MSFHKPEEVICNGERFKVMIPEEELQKRIAEIGAQIDRDYAGKKPILIGVLNGAFIFLADLMRYITIPCEMDFYKLSSYGDAKVSSGLVQQRKDVDANLTGRHVILVEDIIDTGLSASYITNIVEQKKPASVEWVTLLKKSEALKYHLDIKYVCFEIPTLFVLGYGLDYAQEGRNLAQIYVIEDEAGKAE